MSRKNFLENLGPQKYRQHNSVDKQSQLDTKKEELLKFYIDTGVSTIIDVFCDDAKELLSKYKIKLSYRVLMGNYIATSICLRLFILNKGRSLDIHFPNYQNYLKSDDGSVSSQPLHQQVLPIVYLLEYYQNLLLEIPSFKFCNYDYGDARHNERDEDSFYHLFRQDADIIKNNLITYVNGNIYNVFNDVKIVYKIMYTLQTIIGDIGYNLSKVAHIINCIFNIVNNDDPELKNVIIKFMNEIIDIEELYLPGKYPNIHSITDYLI